MIQDVVGVLTVGNTMNFVVLFANGIGKLRPNLPLPISATQTTSRKKGSDSKRLYRNTYRFSLRIGETPTPASNRARLQWLEMTAAKQEELLS